MYLFLLIVELLFILQPISNADFIVPVEIDNVIHQVYVLKRPYVDEFLCRMGELFECVLFTASLAKVRYFFGKTFIYPIFFFFAILSKKIMLYTEIWTRNA